MLRAKGKDHNRHGAQYHPGKWNAYLRQAEQLGLGHANVQDVLLAVILAVLPADDFCGSRTRCDGRSGASLRSDRYGFR